MNRAKCRYLLAFVSVLAAACGGEDKNEACDPVAGSGCEDGLVCEAVTGGGEPVCAMPLVLKGRVFDLADDSAISGARVVALDANGSPASSVAVTDMDGNYSLGVPATRNADGTLVATDVTLRVDAAGYQSFPFGVRQALPISTGAAIEGDGELVVMSALTDVGLLGLPDDPIYGPGSISGTVSVPESRAGILVVAETSSGAGSARGYSAIADRDGEYAIYNLPAGTYDVTAYAIGVVYEHKSADVAGDEDANVDLAIDDGTATGAVEGSVQIVNAPGGSMTSVILVVESTFQENVARGTAPPGMRIPEGGVAPNVTGDYIFEGIPPGSYVVLAAFENDGLVRDPDTSIGGTATQYIEVTAGQTTTVEGFKITEALAITSPGADGPEEVQGAPVLSWVDDSSEDEYLLEVFDAFGNLVWMFTEPGQSGDDPAVTYAGPALESGMYYQFRVTSIKDMVPISRTEDLKGVFFLP